MRILSFIFVLLGATEGRCESPAPWWSQQWALRQNVDATGEWCRVPYDRAISMGRFVDPVVLDVLPHWSQTIELSDAKVIAADPRVHYGFPRMIRASDNRLLLFYRVGTSHASDPATIALRSSADNGASWSEERIIHRDPDGFSAHNPVAVTAADGRVILFVSSYDFEGRRKLPMYWAHSDDHGESWSAFTRFDTDPSRSTYYMTDIERTDAGLFGMSAGFAPDARSQCHNLFWFSPDGREWEMRSAQTLPEENQGNEVDIVHQSGENFMVIHRDRRNETTLRYRSEDAGRSWSGPEDIGDQVEILQRPEVTRLSDGVMLLSGRDRKRALVVVYVSRDGGENFRERHVIDSYSADGAYTTVERLNDHQALLVYYADRSESRGKPDLHQVILTVHEEPTHLCFRAAPDGPTHYYSNPLLNSFTEDRKFAWLQPEEGWSDATFVEDRVLRGDIPLLKQRQWTGSYPPADDPDTVFPYWSIKKLGDANTRRGPDRIIRIYDRGSGANEMAYLRRNWELTPQRKAEIELRLKVVSCTGPGGCMLRVADGQHEEVFTFYPDKVTTNRSGLSAEIDLVSDFVHLSIELGGDSFFVRRGDKLLLDGSGKFAAPAQAGRRIIHFGCGSSSSQGEALWEKVDYRVIEKRE